MTAVTSAQEWSAATTPEVDRHALAGEHALLLRDLRRRADPVLALIAATLDDVPAAADLRSGAQAWLSPTDTPVVIRLDALPRERAVQLCIERLLRLRAGQSADAHSSRGADLQHVCRWMRDFDATGYGFARQPSADGWSGLRVTRRHAP
jgi:hypothetical protein